MADKDMVIKGLKACGVNAPGRICKNECPYYSSLSTSRCKDMLHKDALALLITDDCPCNDCENDQCLWACDRFIEWREGNSE